MKNYLLIILLTLLPNITLSNEYYDSQLKLAEKGIAKAQFNLGVMYYNGEGIPENVIRAYVWSSMAKASGYESAKTNLEIFKAEMTKEQIARAQELAAHCYESAYQNCN